MVVSFVTSLSLLLAAISSFVVSGFPMPAKTNDQSMLLLRREIQIHKGVSAADINQPSLQPFQAGGGWAGRGSNTDTDTDDTAEATTTDTSTTTTETTTTETTIAAETTSTTETTIAECSPDETSRRRYSNYGYSCTQMYDEGYCSSFEEARQTCQTTCKDEVGCQVSTPTPPPPESYPPAMPPNCTTNVQECGACLSCVQTVRNVIKERYRNGGSDACYPSSITQIQAQSVEQYDSDVPLSDFGTCLSTYPDCAPWFVKEFMCNMVEQSEDGFSVCNAWKSNAGSKCCSEQKGADCLISTSRSFLQLNVEAPDTADMMTDPIGTNPAEEKFVSLDESVNRKCR